MKKQYFSKFIFVLLLALITSNIFSQNCTVNAGVPIQWCPGEQMKLFGNVTGLYNGATITWSQISGPAVTIGNTNSLTTTCGTATAGATYVFRISATCQDANVVTNNVTYTVVAATPTPPPANAGITINANCLQWGSTIPLNATAAPLGFIGTWSIVSGGQGSFSNVNSPTATFTPSQQSPGNPGWVCPTNTSSYVLRWTLVSTTPPPAQCPSAQISTFANVTVNVAMWNLVDARAVTPGCGNATTDVQLYGTCRGTGTSQWTLISGPVGYTFTPNAAQNVTLTNPPSGSYTFRYTVTAGSPACTAGFKDVSFNVSGGANFAVTTSNANAGNIQAGVCAGVTIPSLLQLSANLPNVGETGTWSQIAGGTAVVFSNINSNTSTISGMTNAGAPYTFRWTITNALGCSNFSDIIYKTVPAFTPSPISASNLCNASVATGGGTSICSPNIKTQLALSVATNIPKNDGWYMEGYFLDAKPEGSPLTLGYRSKVLFSYITPTLYYSEAMEASCANMGLALIMSNNSFTSFMEFSSYIQRSISSFTGTYSGTVRLKNLYCSNEVSVPFTIEVSHDVSAANAGTDQNLACNVTTTNLAGNDPILTTPFFGAGRWEQISGPNTAVLADKFNRSSQISALIPGTYSFKWTIHPGIGTCPPKQDTVLIRVSAASPDDISAGPDQTVCFGTPTQMTATLTVAGSIQAMLTNTGSTGSWTQVSGPAGATLSAPNEPSTEVSGLLANSVYVFRFTASNFCGNKIDEITINTNNTQGPSKADAGANACLATGTTTLNLSAIAPTFGTGTWTKLNPGDPGTITTPSANTTTVTGVTTSGVYGYIYTVATGGCSSSKDTVYISNSGVLTTPNAGPDRNICANSGISAFTLAGNAITNGTGKWEQISGPTGSNFSNINSPTSTVTVNANGSYLFKWGVTNGACPAIADTVKINFFNRPDPAVITTLNTDLCGPSNGVASLNAQPVTTGVGAWSIINGVGNISSPSSNATTATLQPGTNTIRWSVNALSGVCPSSYDDVIVTYSPNALARDTAFCKATNALIKGSHKGTATSGTWTLINQPGGSPAVTITPQGTQDSIASVGPLVPGVYTFRWTVVHPTCGTTFDDMTLTIDDVSDPNAGIDLCDTVGTSITLSGNAIPVGATATWTRFSAPSGAGTGTFTNATSANASYNITPVSSYLPGTYNFQYQFTKGSCQVRDYVQIRAITNVNAGTNIIQCNTSTFTLNGTALVAGEIGTWTKLNVGDPGTITNINLRNTTVTSLNPGDSINLIWKATTTEGCEKGDTVALVNRINTIANGIPASTSYCDNPSGLNLNGNDPSPGIGSWSMVSAPAGAPAIIWTNQNTQNASIKNLTNGSYTFRYTITNSPCSPSTNDVIINSTCASLPIRLQSFSTKEENCKAILNWVSETEDNFKHYEVEYSKDGINFVTKGTVLPLGNNSQYKFTYTPQLGKSYFRLKMVENDGKTTYSTILPLNIVCGANAIVIYPNPANDVININIKGYASKVKMNLNDYSGSTILIKRLSNGSNQIDCKNIPAGIYTIVLSDENGSVDIRKITVIH
jgi:hypothetical protein